MSANLNMLLPSYHAHLGMIEHEDTIKVVRKDYFDCVAEWFGENYARHVESAPGYDFREVCEKCTVLQLRALCQLIDRGTEFTLLRCNPLDHLAVTFAGMYVGIETDGYTHS